MKLSLMLALATCLLFRAFAQAELPGHLKLMSERLVKRLSDAKGGNTYVTAHYEKDLKEIADEARSIDSTTLLAEGSEQQAAIIFLALQVQEPEVLSRIEEIKGWYGSLDYNIPDELFKAKWERSGLLEIFKKSIGDHRQALKEQAQKSSRGKGKVEELHGKHVNPEYLHAWAFWLMAPPSKEREFMSGRINQALERIGDSSVIPLVIQALKIETSRVDGRDIKRSTALAFVNLICSMPGEKALDALLEINRYAVDAGLNDDDDYITRHIIRRLASRRAYADQLIDPKMKDIIARQGKNERPEEIPLIDERWKQYKPLVIARLKAKTAQTPKADIDLLQAAKAIMPGE